MDGLSSNSFLMMQRSMEFLWSKQSCILDNIANVETPGYQVKYATFEEALKNAVLSSAQNGISSSSIRKAIEETPVVVREAQESVRMDGNGVNITEQSVELARNGGFDLIILDLMMPKIDGLQACMRIREFSNVPVIMLTAKGEDADKIMGFECGADDYITKPFNILELKARVRALLRRSGAAVQRQAAKSPLTVGHIRLDPNERSAWKDGVPVDLTAKEFDLMELLMRNPGRVYSRENLLNVVWGYEYIGDYRTVDVHVRRLREKLELDPANPEYIRTKWGVGYYLSSRPVSAAPSK